VHYEGIHRIDADTGERGEVVDDMQEAVVQCLDLRPLLPRHELTQPLRLPGSSWNFDGDPTGIVMVRR
jgi:hypothetical protein